MSLVPNNIDPSQDYVTPGVVPPLTINGLVYNKIYAHTGVIDSLTQTNTTGYTDPNLDIVNGNNNSLSFTQQLQTYWLSTQDFGGPNSTPVILTYNFSNNTYYNNITFDILNVPCFVEIGYYSYDANTNQYDIWNSLPGASTFVINGGAVVNTITDWVRLNYDAPTYLTATNNIAVRITRNKTVQQVSSNKAPAVNVAYSVGLQNFSIKLKVLDITDVPLAVVSGTASIISQNRFGFVENYNYYNHPVSNMFTTSGGYWKSSPQPVQDAVVYFYSKIGTTSGNVNTPSVINRVYIDPIYTGCKFNVYYTTQTDATQTNPDNYYWTPVQRDFTLRKGIYELPNVTATHLKFEFTKLIPEIYDLPFDGINRTINVFPYDVEQYYSGLESNIINGNAVQYSNIGDQNINKTVNVSNNTSSTLFGYGTQSISNKNSWTSLSNLNNSQYGNTTTQNLTTESYVVDPTISYKLVDQYGQYNNQSYNQFLQRRFFDTRIHQYSQISIRQTWHQSYFVGIQYITAFFENTFDDLRGTPSNLIATNGTTSGFITQDVNYVSLNTNDYALTPWFSTIDSFKSFNIGALASDWKSFLTDSGTLLNIDSTTIGTLGINCTPTPIGYLGISRIVQVSGASGNNYGIQSVPYVQVANNVLTYNDANFITTTSWSGINTNISGTSVNFNTGTISGTASGLGVSGSALPAAAYNFTIPNLLNASGVQTWTLQLGSAPYGTVGYARYAPGSGVSYYFTVNATSSSTNTVGLYTQFVNPSTGAAISGTVVSGNRATVTGSAVINTVTLTGTNYNSANGSIPSNVIQLVVTGTANTPFSLTELGAFTTSGNAWVTPQNRLNMRISGIARILLPDTNQGTYRVSLFGKNAAGNQIEIAYKLYQSGAIPINTWMDIQLQSYTGYNYTNFSVQVKQVNTNVSERFLVSMLSAFYNPLRIEYSNTYNTNPSGLSGWYPITTGVNDPTQFISTVSGVAASGIQLRMTALDSGVFISGVSIIPYYKQNPYFAELNLDYLSNSKTNELSSRRAVSNKPFFQLNKELYPSKWSITQIAPNITSFYLD